VTAVAGVQRGAAFADYILDNITPGGLSEKVAAAIGNGVGRLMDLVTGKELSTPQDFMAALHTLSSAGSVPFNTRFPAGLSATACGPTPTMSGAVPLFSWIGSAQSTNWRDPGDLAFSLTSEVYDEENDGLVGRCSSHFGKVLRDDYAMNHLDEINQFAGLVSKSETSPVAVFRAHVNRLKSINL
jgi:triacylglycerol lipase